MATAPVDQNVRDDSSPASEKCQLSPEDKQTILRLYQQWPQLWSDFRTVIDFTDLADKPNQTSYALIHTCLLKVYASHERVYSDDERVKSFGLFCSVTGFVEVTVTLYRQVMTGMNLSYLTDMSFTDTGKQDSGAILQTLRSCFLNFCVKSEAFSLRLAQAGYLDDALEDLKHIQHMSADALETNGVYFNSAGTIHNVCMHPASLAVVKRMDMVQHIAPFAAKKGGRQMVPAIAYMIMSFIVPDDQLDLLRIDTNTLQYLLDKVKRAVDSHRPDDKGWNTDALLVVFSDLSRCPFNKRIFVAQGAMEVLKLVLKTADRTDKEKRAAVDTVIQLADDPHNLHIIQLDRDLSQNLDNLEATASQEIRDAVSKLLPMIRRPCRSEEDSEYERSFPNLSDLLSDESNVLIILEMGEVEYVMDQLTHFSAEGGTSNGTCLKVLQALTELSCKDEACRREILARGALDKLTHILHNGEKDERTQAARILLELTFSEENREIIKSRLELLNVLSEAAVATDNEDLAETAMIIVQALNQ
ncbi:uncharacterized protein [Littorina saxatilis]|uniref:Uncharacterized protein n=1 Tax=Littorina saxatilis TaxID=31220 RepID=A0AAN9GCH0_9CAEN